MIESDFIIEQTAFRTLNDLLCSPPVLGFANYTLPYELHIDASRDGLGAILYQMQDGQRKPIYYASRGLSASERNYPSHKLEFLGLKWAVTDKFHDYLFGAKFLVKTDNNPLTYVLTTAKLDATGHRWLAELSAYDFTIEYVTGKSNVDADALSRIVHQTTSLLSKEVISAISHALTCTNVSAIDGLVTSQDVDGILGTHDVASTSVKKVDILAHQKDDPIISRILAAKGAGKRPVPSPELRPLLRHWGSLLVKDGILYKSSVFDGKEVERIVLPCSLQDSVLHQLHDDMGHLGRDRVLDLVQSRFFWPGYALYVENYVKTCGRCVRRKPNTEKSSLVSIRTSQPLELVCMDFLTVEPSRGC